MVFLVLALLLTGFLTALSVLGMATLHAAVRVILPAAARWLPSGCRDRTPYMI
ncbi:hypothetical protein HLK65_24855 [Azospirillum formosense]|nr:hypothetical protein [Azospirillum formosense]